MSHQETRPGVEPALVTRMKRALFALAILVLGCGAPVRGPSPYPAFPSSPSTPMADQWIYQPSEVVAAYCEDSSKRRVSFTAPAAVMQLTGFTTAAFGRESTPWDSFESEPQNGLVRGTAHWTGDDACGVHMSLVVSTKGNWLTTGLRCPKWPDTVCLVQTTGSITRVGN
jgi:hypothetical protein